MGEEYTPQDYKRAKALVTRWAIKHWEIKDVKAMMDVFDDISERVARALYKERTNYIQRLKKRITDLRKGKK